MGLKPQKFVFIQLTSFEEDDFIASIVSGTLVLLRMQMFQEKIIMIRPRPVGTLGRAILVILSLQGNYF